MALRDLDDVMLIEAAAYSHPWSRGNFIDSLAAGYIAELLGGPAGLVGYFIAMPGVDELHLLNITVAPAWQGQGHGQALLAVVQDHARARGLAKLWLEVRFSNHRARELYRRQGFVEAGLRRGYYPAAGRREDAVVMSLNLQEPSHGLD
jgi:ribosomal-protein-alanine N-acetyltransferase